MGVKSYSLKTDVDKVLSADFKVKEFACKDKSDEVLIDEDLVILLQKIRDHFKKPIAVISGYRTKTYNTRIGGAKVSQHMTGKAADIQISGVKPRTIAEYAEGLNPGGIGLYEYGGTTGFVHVDTRTNKARWYQASPNGKQQSSSGFYSIGSAPAVPSAGTGKPTLKLTSKGEAVKELQTILNAKGFNCGNADGIFGTKTLNAVRAFQQTNKLEADGIVGPKTWDRLLSK